MMVWLISELAVNTMLFVSLNVYWNGLLHLMQVTTSQTFSLMSMP